MITAQSSPVRDLLALTERPEVISFAGGLPAPELFDETGLRAAFAAALDGDAAGRSLQYGMTEGDPALRELLAALLVSRGTSAHPDEIVVTTGSQQAIALVAAALVRPGDRVLVEAPSYLAALQSFQLAGAVPVSVASDEHGPLPDALDAAIAEHDPALLYLVPTFQNPTGRTIPAERRAALAEVLERTGLWTIEDDPYGELRYDGTPAPPLAGDPRLAGQVIAVSSLSKVVAPGLRIGWLAAPAELHRALVIAKQATDLHTSTVTQAAARHWLAVGHLPGQLARLRDAYRERRDAFVDGLGAALPEGSQFERPDGGMFVWARLPEGHDAQALLARALEHDVAFVPGAAFFADQPDPRALRLSFTTQAPDGLREGLARLARAAR
ncbi:MAG: PLP-dependent aminotransferase family protein [Solirubrobacteraceae bacterium]|nr:PLP-dependent aminotransferase family protein [Solirubrobacteraceae bacterium]